MTLNMPPVLSIQLKPGGVERHYDRLAAVALPDNLNTVGGMPTSGHINCKSLADPPPARFFAAPLNAAGGPWKLVAVVQATAGADDSIGQVRTGALEGMAGGPGVGYLWRRAVSDYTQPARREGGTDVHGKGCIIYDEKGYVSKATGEKG